MESWLQRSPLSQAKIVATLGPASYREGVLEAMLRSGVKVCRLNFSHGTHEDHRQAIRVIRDLSKQTGIEVAILADLQGPKLRIGEVKEGVFLQEGASFDLVSNPLIGSEKEAYMSYAEFPHTVSQGEDILIDDGKLRLRVVSTDQKQRVSCKVINGGPLFSRKGVNLPNTPVHLPSLTEKDREDALFALAQGVDWLGLSFVREAQDVITLKKLIKEQGLEQRVGVLAKIEKPEAITHFDEILEVADAIMVARGDLGVEVSFEQVPLIQKDIIRKSVAAGKPVVVATQMLESMIHNFVPTRAEANDVANAILDGADAVMLSGETSVGEYPVESVQAMEKIICFTEIQGFRFKPQHRPNPGDAHFINDNLCLSATELASQADAKVLVVFTDREDAVLRIASYRPYMPIVVCTSKAILRHRLGFVWGVEVWELPLFERTAQAILHTNQFLLRQGLASEGDTIVYTGHIPFQERREFINMIRVGRLRATQSATVPIFCGKVVKGHQIGRTIGFPTANIDVDVISLGLGRGVYSAHIRVEEETTIYKAMVNVGIRPTFDGKERAVEAHLLNYSGNLYGKVLEVELLEKIREEKKFASVVELKEQLENDLKQVKSLS